MTAVHSSTVRRHRDPLPDHFFVETIEPAPEPVVFPVLHDVKERGEVTVRASDGELPDTLRML